MKGKTLLLSLFKTKKMSGKAKALTALSALFLGGFFVAHTLLAAVTVTPATGGTNISIDTSSASAGAAWTSLGNIRFTESAAADIAVGDHSIEAPVGWEFNTAVNISAAATGGNGFTLASTSILPTATQITFTVNTASTAAVELNFTGIQIRPTGTVAPASFNLTHSGAAINGVTNGSTSLGSLSVVPGAVAKVVVETAADGSGSAVNATSLTADQSMHVYSIQRDQFNNFKSNVAATWTLNTITGGVMNADLDDDVDAKGAVFSGNLVGTAIINANDGVYNDNSGVITVTAGAPATVTINTQPASASSVDDTLDTQPVIWVRDANGNDVSGAHVITSLASGSGTLRGDLDITTNASGVATFTDLAYNKLDAFTINFTVNALMPVTSDPVTVTVGAATKVNVETAANGSGSIVAAQNLASGSMLTVYGVTRDQFDNFVGNEASVWSLTNKTLGVADGNLVAAGDFKSATLTGNLVGTGVIHVTNGALTAGNSGVVTVINGPATKFIILNPTDGTVDSNVIVTVQLQDANNNVVTTGGNQNDDVTLASTGNVTGEALVNLTNGVGTLSLNDHTAETVTLSLVDTEVTGFNVASTQDLVFAHGALHHFNVMGATDPVVAGTASDVTVIAKDLYDNTATSYTGTITFSSSDPLAVLPANYAFVGGDMGAKTFVGGITLKTTGERTVTAASGMITGSQANITVTPDAPVKVNVETAADGSGSIVAVQNLASASSLTAYSITRDQFDNFVGNEASVWSLTNKTIGVADANLVAAMDNKSAIMTGNLVGTGVIHVTNGGLTAGNSGIITVTNGAATKYIINNPTDGTVDNNITVTVELQDINNNIVTVGLDKDKDVTLNGDGSVTGDTLVDINNGVGTLSLNNHVAETVNLSLTDSQSTMFNVASTQDVIFAHGVATKYVITNPTDGTVDSAIPVTVNLQDQYANTITTGADKDKDVTLNVDGSATGGSVVSITNGTGSLNISDQVAETVNLSLTDSQSTMFNVASTQDVIFAHGVATKYIIIDPTDGTVDNDIVVTVKLQDQYANTITTGADKDKDVTLNADGAVTNDGLVDISDGVGTLSLNDHVAETVNLSLTDSQSTMFNVASTQDVIFAHGAMHHFSVTGIADPIVAGTPTSPVVTAQDQYSNTVTNYANTIHFTSNDVQADLPADYLFVGPDNGVKTFTNGLILKTAGEKTVTVTQGAFTGSQTAITVNPAVIASLDISAAPSSLTVGMPSTINVKGYDAYGNLVTNDSSTRVWVHADGFANLNSASHLLLNGEWNFTLNSLVAGTSLVDTFSGNLVPDEVMVTFVGDTTAPTITMNASPVQGITQNSASIVFQSSEAGMAKVHYGLTTSYGNVTNYQAVTAATDKTITITGLTCGTTYNYVVYAKDAAGNETVGTNDTFMTTACPLPVTPTIAINGASVLPQYTQSAADARFASGVQFDLTNTTSVTVNGSTVANAATITAANNAEAKTIGVHSYDVIAISSTGHTASLNVSFEVIADADVTAPTINLVGAVVTAPTSASITFTSSEAGIAKINYGTTNSYGNVSSDHNVLAATNKTITLAGLACETTYHFSINASDLAGNMTNSTDGSFITSACPVGDITAPTLSAFSVDLTQNSAAVHFNTDESGLAKIYYGLTNAYGSITEYSPITDTSDNIINITNLTCGTEYHYKVYGLDASDNGQSSVDMTFTTSACPVAPVITHINPANVDPAQTTAAITLQSDKAGSAKIHYGLSSVYGNVTDYEAVVANTPATITLTGLACGTTYHYSIYAKDTLDNESNTSNYSFVTDDCTVGDITAPTVTAQIPVDNSLAEALTVTPTITFSEAMNAATVNASTVQLRKYSDDSVIASVVSLDITGMIATITPVANLANGTQYYIYVSAAQDLAGNDVTAYVTKADQEFTTLTAPTGAFAIISSIMTKMTGSADNTYAHGWEWLIRMTLPTDQNSFALKFNDWVSGANTLPVAGNMEYYSEQIAAGTGSSASPVAITAANTYPANVTVTNDADALLDGIQTDVHVRVKLPVSTPNGSYSTSYRVNYGL